MHVHFMVPGASTLEHLCDSSLASTRLRIGVAARAINSTKGNECSYGEDVPGKPIDVILVGKIGANDVERRGDAWLSKLRRARQEGARLILDYTDNHLEVPSSMSNFYREAISLVDAAVVPSLEMSHRLRKWFSLQVEVIPDSIEYQCTPTRRSGTTNGIWFGHGSNLQYLVERLGDRNLLARVESLTICTDQNSLKMLWGSKVVSCINQINFIPWSVSNLGAALQNADFALLPVGLGDKRKSGAGPNRLLTALAQGLAVFTQNLSSYTPFKDYYLDIDTTGTKIDAITLAEGRIRAGHAQVEILADFFPDHLSAGWLNLLIKKKSDRNNISFTK